MIQYNFRMIEFPNGTIQLRRYSVPLFAQGLTETEKEINKELREKAKADKEKELYDLSCQCPFTAPGDDITLLDEIEKELSIEEIMKNKERSLKSSMRRTIQRLYELSRSNSWDWFLTFTFDEKVVDRYDYSACMQKLSGWLKNVGKRKTPDMKYLIVPERHPTSGAWHFHGLFRDIDDLDFEIAVNNDKNSKFYGDKLRVSYPDGDFIYNLADFHLGFTTATRIVNSFKTGNYILKYITKDLCELTKGKRRYLSSKGLNEPVKSLYLVEDERFREMLQELIYFGYEISYQKTVDVNCDGYSNSVTYYELQ